MLVQSGKERQLSAIQKSQIIRYLIPPPTPAAIVDDEDSNESISFTQRIVANATSSKKARTQVSSHYRCMNHINPTTNMCERLFSRARLIMSHLRQSMSPHHLEILLFLKANRTLWNALTVQDCLDDPIV